MRNTPTVSVVRRMMTAVFVLLIPTAAIAADDHSTSMQQAGTSLLDQLFSPPAPLRNLAQASAADQTVEQARRWFTLTPGDTGNGPGWRFAFGEGSLPQTPSTTLSDLQQLTSALADNSAARATMTSEQRAMLQSVHGLASGMLTSEALKSGSGAIPLANGDTNGRLGYWLANAAQYANKVQVSAAMPLDESFLAQAPTETIVAAINSREVTEHLEQHSDAVGVLSQLLGWEKTGLLPSATDLQKMASDQVGAVASSIERWALQNVSFSASSQAVTSVESHEQMLQWQWNITNNSQYNSNSIADNETNFSANLRRLFGMNEYY